MIKDTVLADGSRDGLAWRVLPSRVLWVELNRPRRLNAWTDAMYESWASLLTDAGTADNVACVVVTGGMGRAFSAGQDTAEIRSWRLPEPYKGKGIFYKGETVRRKDGKKN